MRAKARLEFFADIFNLFDNHAATCNSRFCFDLGLEVKRL